MREDYKDTSKLFKNIQVHVMLLSDDTNTNFTF